MADYKLGQTGSELQSIIDHVETFDSAPTAESQKAVTSAGIKAALDAKANQSTTYTKEEINNLLNPIGATIVWVASADWPLATGEANTIYCVEGSTSFTCYGWTGTEFQELATYNWIVDAVPTAGSHNPVESGGVYNMVKPLEDAMNGNETITTDITSSFSSWDDGRYLNANSNHQNFGLPAPTTGFKVSGFVNISAYAGKTLHMTFASVNTDKNFGVCFYSSNDVTKVEAGVVFPYVAGQGNTYAPYTIDILIESGWNYLRTTYFMASDYPTAPAFSAVVVASSSRGTLQEQIDDLVDDMDEIDDGFAKKVDILVGVNLYDSRKVTTGKFLDTSGRETSNSSYGITDYIPVEASTDYYLSADGGAAITNNANTTICFYDVDKVLIPGGIVSTTAKLATSPATAAYLRASIALSKQYIQIEKGTARTEYTPYSEIGGYTGNITTSLSTIQKYKPVVKLYPALKTLAAISFIWDDGPDVDDDVVAAFNEYGAKCGFALIGNSSFATLEHSRKYLQYQKEGFSCLNHNSSTSGLPSYADEAAARAAVVLAKNRLENFGLTINGFVCPNNSYVNDYRTMLGTFHAYAFGSGGSNYNNKSSDILKLVRTAIESDSHTLQDIKDKIDAVCSDGGLMIFYGHAARIGTAGYNDMDFYRDVLAYINGKRDAGLCYFDNPDNCVKYYFEL